jgi:hypothetical protein
MAQAPVRRLVDAPPVATEAFPALADAPGTYVLER